MKKLLTPLVLLFLLTVSVHQFGSDAVAGPDKDLPAPQLVTDAWMFIAAFKTNPKVLKELLPPGLEPNPEGQVVINMYTVPEPSQTSGFGAYTLTYLTVELKDHDSYVMGSDVTYPGRYFVYYFNSSPSMRDYTKKIGIPAQEGMTVTEVKDGKLTATLTVDGKPFIVATADIGSELSPPGGGHLNYFGLINAEQSGESKNQVVKYPIPWNGGVVETTNAKIKFKAPRGHPLRKIKPKADPTWAIWTKGSFVYPQYQVINEF
ncbi:MAG: acetoacetate decarboxylase family protein [Thermodesulfobacteriota bacterium]